MLWLASCKRWLTDGWHWFPQCNLLQHPRKHIIQLIHYSEEWRLRKEECCVCRCFVSKNRELMSRKFIFKLKGRKDLTEIVNGNWLFVRELHWELGVQLRIVSKTTHIGKDCEDRKGQRHRWRSNLRPCRPRFQMHQPGEEGKNGKTKRKRKWNRKKRTKCRELAAPAWWLVYAVKPILHCRPLCLYSNNSR